VTQSNTEACTQARIAVCKMIGSKYYIFLELFLPSQMLHMHTPPPPIYALKFSVSKESWFISKSFPNVPGFRKGLTSSLMFMLIIHL